MHDRGYDGFETEKDWVTVIQEVFEEKYEIE